MARRTSSITILAAILAALLAFWAPAASAHHKDDHPQGKGKPASSPKQGEPDGDADSNSDTAFTEEDDNDGVPNAPDPEGDADNKHPSGKDKHEEPGGSGNQGSSESDPDGDENGGADKPNGSGGTDLLDQDGNNGCGNDDDFEDDNNGNCGKPEKEEEDVVAGLIVDKPAEKVKKVKDAVMGIRFGAPQSVGAAVAPAAIAKAAPKAKGSALPFTGSSDLLPLVAVALMLIAAGALGLRATFSSK